MRSSSWIILAAVVALATPLAAQDWKGRARLDGQVSDQDGAPLGGATVTIESLTVSGGPVASTDSEGRWVVDDIAAGSWVVEISAPGYDPRRIGVHLPSESSWLAPLEVRLKRTQVEPPSPPANEETTGAVEAGIRSETRADLSEFRAALAAGRIDRAYEILSALDEDTRVDGNTLVEMGAAFLTAGETAAAVALFDRAVERDPEHVEAHYRRALGLLALGRPGKARTDFETVVELDPGSAVAEKAERALEEIPPASGGATR